MSCMTDSWKLRMKLWRKKTQIAMTSLNSAMRMVCILIILTSQWKESFHWNMQNMKVANSACGKFAKHKKVI